MEMNSVEALLNEQLKDLYSAEGQLLKALPKMARKASDASLREAIESHLEETRTHFERLQELGESLGIKLGGHKCKAMEGLIEEASEALELDGDESVIDAAIIAGAQRIEHYEISAYGTARTLAERVGETKVAETLQQTLDEEYAADEKLTQICEGELLTNAPLRAASADDGDDSSDFMSETGAREDDETPARSGSRRTKGATRSRTRASSAGSKSSRPVASRSRAAKASSSSTRARASSRSGGRAASARSGSTTPKRSSARGSSARSAARAGSRSASSSSRGSSRAGGRSSRSSAPGAPHAVGSRSAGSAASLRSRSGGNF